MNTLKGDILVTGAAGYIGSHLCKLLHESGHVVDGMDLNWSTHNKPYRYLNKMWSGNFNDFYWRPVGEYETVIHLGGVISVEESMRDPMKYFETNTLATNEIIEELKPKNFIFASTAAAFDPVSPYALSKLMSEHIVRQKCKDYTILRFFNVAGNDSEFRQVGPATHLIRIAAEAAAGKRDKMYLYGTDYDTPDGTCVRDYIHVQDLVDAIRAAIYNPMNSSYECLGTGSGYSCREVIDMMKRVSGVDFEVVEADRRPGDAPVLVVDRPSSLLNCKRTLEDMCRSAYTMEMK